MMTVVEAISDLLFVRETVVVPGLGAFVKKPLPAVVDLESNRFVPPSCSVGFDSSLREENAIVARYLSEKEDVPFDEAARRVASFVADCFYTMKRGKPFKLEGIGELVYDANSSIRFRQDDSANFNSNAFGLAAFTLSPVTHQKTEEKVKDGTFWYWAALAACMLIGVFFGIRQFGVFDKETVEPTVEEKPLGYEQEPMFQQNVPPVETTVEVFTDSPLVPQDSLVEVQLGIGSISVTSPTLTRSVPATQYRVVGGCYDREENAVWFANILYGVGFREAFYEKHGERWFVVFAPYETFEEALEALTNIRTTTSYQAWIQVPKEK